MQTQMQMQTLIYGLAVRSSGSGRATTRQGKATHVQTLAHWMTMTIRVEATRQHPLSATTPQCSTRYSIPLLSKHVTSMHEPRSLQEQVRADATLHDYNHVVQVQQRTRSACTVYGTSTVTRFRTSTDVVTAAMSPRSPTLDAVISSTLSTAPSVSEPSALSPGGNECSGSTVAPVLVPLELICSPLYSTHTSNLYRSHLQ
jgi:hypothetical protein